MCVGQIVVASTTLFLVAGRFGLTPSANRLATPGLKLVDNKSGLMTGDPAGEEAWLGCSTIGEMHLQVDSAVEGLLVASQGVAYAWCNAPGFTATDVLYLGTIGHVVAIGELFDTFGFLCSCYGSLSFCTC